MKPNIVKSIFTALGMCLFLAYPSAAVAGVLDQIDAYRLPSSSVEVEIEITAPRSNTVKYLVAQSRTGSSRTKVLNTKRKGQQYLNTSRGLWFYTPGTRRAIRVPPLQRLQGQTVLADITRLQFGSDYRLASSKDTRLDGRAALELTLQAKTKTSFKTVILWVDKKGVYPLKAHFFLASGKLFRVARYAAPQNLNIPSVGATKVTLKTTFYAPDTPNSTTVLRTKSITPRKYPRRYFNADALTRDN